MRWQVAASAIVLSALLAGCTVGPDYRKPPILSSHAPGAALTGADDPAFDQKAQVPGRWWQLYNDPLFDTLEEKALTRNTDLRVALATLEQAQAELRGVELRSTPQTSLTIDPTYGQASGDANGAPGALKPGAVYDAMESISYDLDLFGRLRRSIEAGRADVEVTQAAMDLARVNIAGQTANAYSSICSAGLQIAVTDRSITLARRTLDVTQRRFDAGIAGINDVVRARTLLRQTEASLPALEGKQRTALFTLATLTGDTPEAFSPEVAGCVKPPLIRSAIPVGDGAALLARRPDVRQAERTLASAIAGIGVSTADLYPSITIGGGFGTTATALGHVVQNRAFHWNVGPMITWNFPNFSAARAEIAGSNAAARGALGQFDGTVLKALRETDSALVTLARQLDTERDLTGARDDAATAQRNVARLYDGGIGEFLDTLDAERTLIEADSNLAQATGEVSQDQIALFMALGGGWQEAPLPDRGSLGSVTAPR
jgi:outer membrane protein, multidrug efflux system